ncbi:NAD(P)/FAD-dependent oxidoreductase [Amycolatopsis sp. NPDC004772]
MRVVIVGGGFAGYHAAKSLRKEAGEDVEVVVLNPTDYFLYLPLLPEVAAGILDPRRVAVSIPETLRGVRLVLGVATGVDFDARHVTYTDPEDNEHRIGYDRLVLAAGSVNKLLPIPGVPEYAHGFRGVPEALYLRDHITRQIELAAAAEDPAERDARCTFVVVGAGYTGTEVAAQGPAFTAALAARHPELAGQKIRWLLLDVAERVLPELDKRLGRTADEVLRARGVEVLMKTSVDHADAKGVTLTNGDAVPARTLVWCVGVRPDPLVADLGLETAKGRLVVTEQLNVPGRDDVFACGDAAAVPDLTRPGQYTAMTAQHAERQGRLAGRNVAASLGYGRRGSYRHHDLGFVVDLGAGAAAANPLHIPLSGRPAKAVTRGYHLMSMPGNRVRTAADWVLEALTGRQTVQLGLVRSGSVPLDTDSPELPRR